MRVVFFGSPEFAVPTLKAIAGDAQFDVALVVTQGAKGPSPVEALARSRNLPVYKPASLAQGAARAPLVEAQADLFVVAAFGLIFRQRTLEIPRFGAVNVHPSLLPRYRGASPIMAAILSGNRETGVSLMAMDAGIDTGSVISSEMEVVRDDDTTESLSRRLALVGAGLAVRDIPRWVAGELIPRPQPDEGASLTRPLTKADGEIDWSRPAAELERHVRAMWPWPRAWTLVDGTPLQIHEARVAADAALGFEPGQVIAAKKELVVACGNGALELVTVEPAGRRAMSAQAYLNGRRSPLTVVGSPEARPAAPPLIAPVPQLPAG